MNEKNNIKSPLKFQEKLQEVMDGIYELFELAKEHYLAPVSEDGVICYDEDEGKTGFQVAGQFDKPSEFLQTLLDIIRVHYEPCVLGTFFLNSNIGFLYERIPASTFQLGYLSITSESDKPFASFWQEDVIPYIENCGYAIKEASAIYAVASTGFDRYAADFAGEVSGRLDSGFSVEEGINLLAASISGKVEEPNKQIYAGFCPDVALENKIRLSLWLFTNHHKHTVQ